MPGTLSTHGNRSELFAVYLCDTDLDNSSAEPVSCSL